MAKPGALVESWYVNCAFVTLGKPVGFLCHQAFPARGRGAGFMVAAARRAGGLLADA